MFGSAIPFAVAIRVKGDGEALVRAALSGVAGIARIETAKGASGQLELHAIPRDGALIAAEVAALLREKSVPVEEIFVERGKLDDVFRQITTTEGEAYRA